ncbi:MAG: DsbA family protein [Sphingomonadaceae bacterium]
MSSRSRKSGAEKRISPPARSAQAGSKGLGPGDSRPATQTRQWPLLVALASTLGVALGVVMIALSLLSAGSPAAPLSTGAVAQNSSPSNSQAATGPERRAVGSPDASVVVTEWFDFQCPACRIYTLTRDIPLEQQYAAAGKVRFVYRNYAFLGLESILAAEAAECAADQGRYNDYRLALMQRQRGENLGTFKAENLEAIAAELGLNQATFNACLDNGVYRQAVLAERREGEALGVNATPTIFVNDRKMEGVPTLDRMKAAIEEELAKR